MLRADISKICIAVPLNYGIIHCIYKKKKYQDSFWAQNITLFFFADKKHLFLRTYNIDKRGKNQ